MRRTWQLPEGVPSGRALFFDERRYLELKWVMKYIKRRLFCFIAVEHFGLTREVSEIGDSDVDILWINWSAPSLGDSLMDLSARVLLSGKSVTLLTHPKNVSLYHQDPYFKAVFSDPFSLSSKLGWSAFDLVLCDAFSPRVLFRKLVAAPFVKFAGTYGYLNGFEVHRTRYAFSRMEQLLGLSGSGYPRRPFITTSEDSC
jgi:hypothetical protein